jgi:hypothetical protein
LHEYYNEADPIQHVSDIISEDALHDTYAAHVNASVIMDEEVNFSDNESKSKPNTET